MTVNTAKIFELAKRAEFLYKSQNPRRTARLLETVLSNCTLNSGTLTPTYTKPFDLLVKGNETGIGGEGGIRTHVPVTRQDAFEAPPLRPLRYLSVEEISSEADR